MEIAQQKEKEKKCSLLLLSGFSFCLIAFRIIMLDQLFYGFLIINLALASIPFLISSHLKSSNLGNRKWFLVLASMGWLLFLPNAPYILTDFLHFKRESSMPEWFDVLLLASFTCSGLAFCFVSLKDMHQLWKAKFGSKTATIFIFCCCMLSGFGIYLGRFLRFNSWDMLHKPFELLVQLPPLLFELKAIGFSLGYGLFILLFYNFFSIHTKNY